MQGGLDSEQCLEMYEVPSCCRSSVVLFLLHSNDCPMSVHHCLHRVAQDESRSVVHLVGVNLRQYLCASD